MPSANQDLNQELLDRTRFGFEAIDLKPEIKQSALTYLEGWLAHDKFDGLLDGRPGDYRPLLEWMITGEKFNLLLDSFYQVMPFGTGGRRGPVGIGPNRINPYTMASSIQGHVQYLRDLLPGDPRQQDQELKVVVAYDVRQYEDLRQLYPPDLPNPVYGFSSRDFAHIAASVYCAGGVTVHMLPDELNEYISTPELSFFIRLLGAHGGLNVSASHNHPDDNGGKFYNGKGGQEIPPNDERMVKIVETISEVASMPYSAALETGLIRPITAEHRQAYIDLNLGLRLRSEPGAAKIVFTPLHGTGRNTVGRCLNAAGFEEGKQFFTVEAQREYRGDFANVKFRTPNPEVPESLELAIEEANRVGADVALATDPDADRIGAAVRRNGEMVFVTGNELAIILTRYRMESLQRAGKLPATPLVLKTEVTSGLMATIAESFGAQIIGDLLVGFKYVGDVLDQLERTGHFGDLKAGLSDFVLAAEESHGLLLTPEIRDKDAAGAAIVLAELTSDLKEAGKTLYDYLIETYKRFGYCRNLLRSTIMQGAAGTAAINDIQERLRSDPPLSIGGVKVLSINDYWDEQAFGAFKSDTDRSSRNLLTINLDNGLRAVIRPSGTEPKNKVYIEKASEPLGAYASDEEFEDMQKAIDDEVLAFSNAFMATMLKLIDVELPSYALEISDLVSLENKRHFVEKFVPAFEDRAKAVLEKQLDADSVQTWIDSELKPYGADARLLVARAFRSWLAACRRDEPELNESIVGGRPLFFNRAFPVRFGLRPAAGMSLKTNRSWLFWKSYFN